jgi:hypothetical protein
MRFADPACWDGICDRQNLTAAIEVVTEEE